MAIYHFMVQSIFIPDIRLTRRWKFFETRDRLREMYNNSEGKISRDAFEIMDSNINECLKYVHSLDFFFIKNFYEQIQTDKKLLSQIKRVKNTLDGVEHEEFQDLREQFSKDILYTCVFNSLGTLPEGVILWILSRPIVFAIKASRHVFKAIKNTSSHNAFIDFFMCWSALKFVRNLEISLGNSKFHKLSF